MQIVLDLLRGLGLYIWLACAAAGYGWLMLPPIEDRSRMFTSIGGGGCILLLVVIVVLSGISATASRS